MGVRSAEDNSGAPPGWTDQTSSLVVEALADFLEYEVSHFIKITKVEEYAPDRDAATMSTRDSHHNNKAQNSLVTTLRRAFARQWRRSTEAPLPYFLRDAPPPIRDSENAAPHTPRHMAGAAVGCLLGSYALPSPELQATACYGGHKLCVPATPARLLDIRQRWASHPGSRPFHRCCTCNHTTPRVDTVASVRQCSNSAMEEMQFDTDFLPFL